MEAVHHQVTYGLGQDLKSYPLSIPVINFNHIDDTDVKRLQEEYNNNNDPLLYKQYNGEKDDHKEEKEQPSKAEEFSDNHETLCLSLRLKQLKGHIDWIHSEMVCM